MYMNFITTTDLEQNPQSSLIHLKMGSQYLSFIGLK